MATMTGAQLADLVLEHIGVKPAGQSASAEDAALVSTAIDSAHGRLSRLGIAPFRVDLIPEWAQVPFRDYVAGDVGASFGLGDSLRVGQQMAERELARQASGQKPPMRIRAEYY